MPILLRPRIYCFYCGTKSSFSKGQSVRKFQCASCEGTNHLDQNDEITDVPFEDSDSPVRNALRFARPQSPPQTALSSSSSDGLFCTRCLKNQRFMADCLANYLPSESDPRYEQFLAGYDDYKLDLEKRYPQVCQSCEPRVREQVKRNSYVAQSDAFNRSLARRTASSVQTAAFNAVTSGPWHAVLVVAELVWWASILIDAVWHAACLMTLTDSDLLIRSVDGTAQSPHLVRSVFGKWSVSTAESTMLYGVANRALITSILVSWWNPALLRFPATRVEGVLSFYQLQGIMLGLRAAAWFITSTYGEDRTVRAIHAFMCICLPGAALLSYRAIHPAKRQPTTTRRDLDRPLIDNSSVPDSEGTEMTNGPSPPGMSFGHGAFNISDLGSRGESPRRAQPATHAPLDTTGIAEPNDDAMDWEPVVKHPRTESNLRPRIRQSAFRPADLSPGSSSSFGNTAPRAAPSPFYGQLPAAPQSLEARLRSSAQREAPQFRPNSDAKQADWFKRLGLAQSQGNWARQDYVHSVRDDTDHRSMDLAEGKLRLDKLVGSAGQPGTGLEDIFGSSFKIDDREESPVKEVVVQPDRQSSTGPAVIVATFIYVVALLSLGLWWFLPDQWRATMEMLDMITRRIQDLAYGHTSPATARP